MTTQTPVIGQWYRHLDKGQEFQVVALDEDSDTVEMQHFDGDLEELDLQSWFALPLEPIAEPENWSGALDVGEIDDLGTEMTDTRPGDWTEPLEEILKKPSQSDEL